MTSSRRASGVQLPVIPTVAGWIAETPGTISLGQGVAYYGPPPEAMRILERFASTPGNHPYKPDAGLPELRRAFEEKLRVENGIDAPFERRILVTAGANQAFFNTVLAICDPGDEVVLLTPYYFNHEMAIAGRLPGGLRSDGRELSTAGRRDRGRPDPQYARGRHGIAEQSHRRRLSEGDAFGNQRPLRPAGDLSHQRRGLRTLYLRRRNALLPGFPRRRGPHDLALQPLQVVRNGELEGRIPGRAPAPLR
jgi:hypothetical protein